MRKLILVVLLFLGLGAAFFWGATALPEEARTLESQVLESLRRNDESLADRNGYQSLIELWGPPWEWSADQTRLARYRRRTMKRTLAAVARQPQEFAADLEVTEAFLEPLLQALMSPRIVWESALIQDPYNLEDLRGFPGMQGVSSMLMVGGFHYVERGRVDEGLRLIVTACEFPNRFSDHRLLNEGSMQWSAQLSAAAGLLEVLNKHRLTEAQLVTVAEALARAQGKREAFGAVLDTEYTMTRRRLGRIESRRLADFYLKFRAAFHDPLSDLTLEEFKSAVYEAGVTDLFPWEAHHLIRAREGHRVYLTVISATRLVVAIQIHQRRHGSYPERLEELDFRGEDVFRGGASFDYHSDGADFTLGSESPRYLKLEWYAKQSYYPMRPFRPDPREKRRRVNR